MTLYQIFREIGRRVAKSPKVPAVLKHHMDAIAELKPAVEAKDPAAVARLAEVYAALGKDAYGKFGDKAVPKDLAPHLATAIERKRVPTTATQEQRVISPGDAKTSSLLRVIVGGGIVAAVAFGVAAFTILPVMSARLTAKERRTSQSSLGSSSAAAKVARSTDREGSVVDADALRAELEELVAIRRYRDALDLATSAVEQSAERNGANHSDTAVLLSLRAWVCESGFAFDQAIQSHLQALTIRQSTLGEAHEDTQETLRRLSKCYLRMSRWTDAEDVLRQALAVKERTLGPDHLDTAKSIDALAYACVFQRAQRRDEVLRLYKRSLAIREKALGSDDPKTAGSLRNVGYAYESMFDDDASAVPFLQRALAIYEKALGPGHADTREVRDMLRACEERVGRE